MSGGGGDLESETRVCKRWITRRQERVRKRRRGTRPLYIYNSKKYGPRGPLDVATNTTVLFSHQHINCLTLLK
jgi:hypothetical protein